MRTIKCKEEQYKDLLQGKVITVFYPISPKPPDSCNYHYYGWLGHSLFKCSAGNTENIEPPFILSIALKSDYNQVIFTLEDIKIVIEKNQAIKPVVGRIIEQPRAIKLKAGEIIPNFHADGKWFWKLQVIQKSENLTEKNIKNFLRMNRKFLLPQICRMLKALGLSQTEAFRYLKRRKAVNDFHNFWSKFDKYCYLEYA